MKTTGEKIRERRTHLGLTQTELANKIGVTLRTITKYEKQGVMPRGRNLRELAKVLGEMFTPYPTPAHSTTASVGVSSSSVPFRYSIISQTIAVQLSIFCTKLGYLPETSGQAREKSLTRQ